VGPVVCSLASTHQLILSWVSLNTQIHINAVDLCQLDPAALVLEPVVTDCFIVLRSNIRLSIVSRAAP
jgi:hypothetical protein